MRIWFPVVTKFRKGYNIFKDEYTTEYYSYIISLAFERITNGIQIRLNYGWSPEDTGKLIQLTTSRLLKKFIEDSKRRGLVHNNPDRLPLET